MQISFNDIPPTVRVPGAYVEFDSTRAMSGLQAFEASLLIIAQKLPTGAYPTLIPQLVTNLDQAIAGGGRGSMLAHMMARVRDNNEFTRTLVIAVDDAATGVKASGSIAIGGTAAESGLLRLYLGGRQVLVRVAAGQTGEQVAAALVLAISADADLAFTAAASAGTVTVTAKHAGECGNSLHLTANLYDGERTPAGLTLGFTQPSGGAGNPDIAPVLAAIEGMQFDYIAMPWSDGYNLAALEATLEDRWGPMQMQEGLAFIARSGTVAELDAFGSARNSKFVTCIGQQACPSPDYEVAAAYAAVAAYHLPIDPARPLQTLPLKGILPPRVEHRFSLQEANLLLYAGMATTYVDFGGQVRIQREISMYQTNPYGQPDPSYLDIQTFATLSYLRKDVRFAILTKFPRHKLANDGTNFSAGQAIVTPNLVRSELISRFKLWEQAGLVEDIDQFKRDLIVTRNGSDPNRLDALIPPNLVNQFRVFAAQIQYLL